METISVVLESSAIINGKTFKKGSAISVYDLATVNKGYKRYTKSKIRKKIKVVGDTESLLGVVSDAAAYSLDAVAIDICAIAGSEDSSYKAQRILFFEKLYGAGAWNSSVSKAQEWVAARANKKIVLPVDAKGVATVFADVAARGHAVATILKSS